MSKTGRKEHISILGWFLDPGLAYVAYYLTVLHAHLGISD